MLRAAERLEAMERMNALDDHAIGTGMAKKEHVRAHVAELRRKALGPGALDPVPTSATVNPFAALRAVGVNVIARKGPARG